MSYHSVCTGLILTVWLLALGADHLPLSSVKGMHVWSCPPYAFVMGAGLIFTHVSLCL